MSVGAVDNALMMAVNQVYQSAAARSVTPMPDTEEAATSTQDTAILSDRAREMLEWPPLFGGESNIKTFGEKQLAAFGKEFRALMRGNDIDMSQPIQLGHEPGTGRVIVTNDHPDADKIESLLDDRFDLRNMYTGATNALSLVKHAEEHAKFAKAYAQNPQAAVAQYAYLFNTRWDTTVTFSGEDHEVQYDRVPR